MTITQSIDLGITGEELLEYIDELRYIAIHGKSELYDFDDEQDKEEQLNYLYNDIKRLISNLKEK